MLGHQSLQHLRRQTCRQTLRQPFIRTTVEACQFPTRGVHSIQFTCTRLRRRRGIRRTRDNRNQARRTSMLIFLFCGSRNPKRLPSFFTVNAAFISHCELLSVAFIDDTRLAAITHLNIREFTLTVSCTQTPFCSLKTY